MNESTVASLLSRWHVTTQELLIRHLREIWSDATPRVMVDLGAHAGHGLHLNVSDALIWLDYFHEAGSDVLALDAFEDFALDLQHRFDDLPRYRDMAGVRKRSVHGAVAWRKRLRRCGNFGALPADVVPSCQTMPWLGKAVATAWQCTRTGSRRPDDFKALDAVGFPDHYCRITRQRAGMSTSKLPLPHAMLGYPTRNGTTYAVPVTRLAWLREHMLSRRRIDFDVDRSWALMRAELLPLVEARGFKVMVLEMDDRPGASSIDDALTLFHSHGFGVLLKVPCFMRRWQRRRGGHGRPPTSRVPWWSQRAAYYPLTRRQEHVRFPNGWAAHRRLPCNMGGGQCNVQDLLVVDLEHTELAGLVDLGNRDCGTHFPRDLSDSWARSPAAADGAAEPIEALRFEDERNRPALLHGGAVATGAS